MRSAECSNNTAKSSVRLKRLRGANRAVFQGQTLALALTTQVAVVDCCREERDGDEDEDEDEDDFWWHSGGSGSGRDNVMSEDAILDVLCFQCPPSLFEKVRNLCVVLTFRATIHHSGHGHRDVFGRSL